jgi:acyl carrier protein
MVDKIPRTTSGKVDRSALPLPPALRAPHYAPPATPTEEIVASVWRDVLGIKRIGVDDDFLNLGGHSLLSLQIVGRLSSALAMELTLQDVAECTTVAETARTIDGMVAGGRATQFVRIEAADRSERLRASLLQEGRLLFELGAETQSAPFLQGIAPLGLSFYGTLNVEALERGIRETVKRHEALRTAFDATAYVGAFKMDGWKQIREFFGNRVKVFKPKVAVRPRFVPEVKVPLDRVDLEGLNREQREEAIEELLNDLVETAFDYETPPSLRAVLVRVNAVMHILYVAFSHVVADGWSMALFSGEVMTRYAALSAGKEPDLPPLPVQYADFAQWQRRRLQGRVLDRMLAYCERRFRGVRPFSADALPFARPPWHSDLEAAPVVHLLSGHGSDGIRKFAGERRASPYVVLLAALNAVLFLLTDMTRIGIWTFLANRSHPDTENLIGWFAQDHLLVLDLSRDPTASELVIQARNVVTEANAYQDVPPALIARELERMPAGRLRISFEMLAQPRTDGASPRHLRVGPAPMSRNRRHPEMGLKLRVVDFGAGPIVLNAQYAADRFRHLDVQNLLREIAHVARRMVQFPHARLSSFQLEGKPSAAADR